jgi:hypothetical protein
MMFDLSKKKSLRSPRHFGSNCLVWDGNQQGQLNFSPFFDFPHSSFKTQRCSVSVIHAVDMLDELPKSSIYDKKKPLPELIGAA